MAKCQKCKKEVGCGCNLRKSVDGTSKICISCKGVELANESNKK